MATVTIPLHVDPDGRITGRVPSFVPPGNYTAPLQVPDPDGRPASAIPDSDWPIHDPGAWPAGFSLHREDLYGEEG